MPLLLYEVTKQFVKGNEQVRARFADQKDAKEFLEAKAAWDRQTRVDANYFLYNNGELVLKLNTLTHLSQVNHLDSNTSSGGSSGQQASTSPFVTIPRPSNSLPPKSDKRDSDDVI